MTNFQTLNSLGWGPFFQQQLSLEEWTDAIPARIVEQHKSIIELVTDNTHIKLPLTPTMPAMVVGDWLLLQRLLPDKEHQFLRLLDRKSCFRRKSPGTDIAWQLIAANVDTAFIVCSLNEDFNLSRIERYLSLVNEAEVEPVVILTKSDLVQFPESWKAEVENLDPNLSVLCINALDQHCISKFSDWIETGKTCVLLGSSGVGKSTISNTLLGEQQQSTSEIRESDQKGRHTTTRRSLIPLPSGGLLLDIPGMRELQIADCQDGIANTFTDIVRLAKKCRFSDCQHLSEPGCAVRSAIESGELQQRRLNSYLKLVKEESFNSASLAEKRAKDKSFGKFIKQTLKDSYKLKGR